MPMNLAYIHQFFSTPQGKSGTRSYEFARRWVKAGNQVTVITSNAVLTEHELKESKHITKNIVQFNIEGIQVIVLNVAYSQKMGNARRLWAFLNFFWHASIALARLKDIDIVFATSTPLTVALPALALKFLRGTPFVFEVRDLQPRGYIKWNVLRNRFAIKLALWFERFVYTKTEGVVALSTDMKGYIDRVTEEPEKAITVMNCSDIDLFKPLNEKEKQEIRNKFGWHNKFIIIHTGAMGKVNGLHRVVETANRIKTDQKICFVLIGDGKEKPRIEKMVADQSLNNVLFMKLMPKVELAPILAAADAGLVSIDRMPHMQFNSANKFFDYLACGLPVLLNYGGWQREVLNKHNAGLGCDIFDDDEFIKNIMTLYKNPSLCKIMGQNARKLAENEFNRDILAQKVLDFVSKCLTQSKK